MEIISRMFDKRINSESVFIELDNKEYISFASNIINNNNLQRRKVKSSNTVYSLLKNDLKIGCIIPPIVLALSDEKYSRDMNNDKMLEFIKLNLNKLLILDGLQRTYNILIVEEELRKDEYGLEAFYDRKMRIELYLGINKFGILYRMLTLNTGQTPMSIGHQIEMLYKDYLNVEMDGICLVEEKESVAINKLGVYKFKDVIEGFNSYLDRNELPIDRIDILQNIKSLEKLAQENQQHDIFSQFISVYNSTVRKLHEITGGYEVVNEDLEEYEIETNPFGKSVIKIFNKSQALTGFGAALGKLKDFNVIKDINDINELINNLQYEEDSVDWMLQLIKTLEKIKKESKKIGNSQRMYFQYFFRELFNKESDSYLNLNSSVENSYNKYRSQV